MLFLIILFLLIVGAFLFLPKNKLSYIGMGLIAFSISIPDFFYVPSKSDDLYRYYEEMNIIAPYNNIHTMIKAFKLSPVLKYHSYNFIYDILEWLISKTNVFSLLPVTIVCITYFLVSCPSIHQRNKYNMSLKATIFSIIMSILLFPYWATSSTVRWALASGIFLLITYLCFNANKKCFFLLYIIPCLIHEGILFPVLLAIICIFIKKFRWYHFYALLAILCILFFIILPRYTMQYSTNIFSIATNYTKSMNFNSMSAVLYFLLPILASLLYSIGDFLIIRSNKLYTMQREKTLFYVFNFAVIFFISRLVIFGRYMVIVGIIDILVYLQTKKLHILTPHKTKVLYVTATLINLFVFIYFSKGMQFNFSNIYMFE